MVFNPLVKKGFDKVGQTPDLSGYALKSNVLELNNTTPFTPDADYEPATKKYVDDNAVKKSGDTMTGDLTVPGVTVDTDTITTDKTNHFVGMGTATPGGRLHILTTATNKKGLVIQGIASQAANYLEIQDSVGTPIGWFDVNKNLHATSFYASGSLYLNENGKPRMSGDANGSYDFNYGNGATGGLSYWGGGTSRMWRVTNTGAMECAGTMKASGGYLSSDGTAGVTGTITLASITSLIVKNGLIVGSS